MMKKFVGLNLLILLVSGSLISTFAYPNSQPPPDYKNGQSRIIHQQASKNQGRVERKFVEKPNAIKKVALDDLDDIQTNDLSQSGAAGGGFSWSNLLGQFPHSLFFSNFFWVFYGYKNLS